MAYVTLNGLYEVATTVFDSGTNACPCLTNGRVLASVTKSGSDLTYNFADDTSLLVADSGGFIYIQYSILYFAENTAVWVANAYDITARNFDRSTLVYDRTLADVVRAKQLRAKGYANLTADEQTEWNAGLKGCLNREDAQRVDRACKYLYALAEALGFTDAQLTQINALYQYYFPWVTGENLHSYESHTAALGVLESVYPINAEIAAYAPSMFRVTFSAINALEQRIYEQIGAMESAANALLTA